MQTTWGRCIRLLLAALLALVALVRSQPVPESNGASSSDSQAMDRIFTTLVQSTFGPQHLDHADTYYKTRFFTAHLQARMRLISSGQSASKVEMADASLESNEKSLELSQSEADQLNAIMREMWLASRKLFQSRGCLSYDLTLCNGQSKGVKYSESEKQAMAEWQKRLSTPVVAGKALDRKEAKEIGNLMKNIHTVLLANNTTTS
ncbi:hypothetical protein GGI07_000496 [Coemansia sp. Benny D115]|nr:hypothetical protein GGI07_000496 [Coemansia sp. Benny D115]